MHRTFIAAVVLLASASTACSNKAPVENQAAEPLNVTTAVAHVDTLVDRLTAPGTVVIAKAADVTIVAPESATIAELPKQEGDHVEAGDLLVRFDIVALSEALELANANVSMAASRVEAAKSEVTKLSALDARGMLPRSQMDAARNALLDAQSGLSKANADLAAAKARQSQGEVRAKFPGVVIKRWHVEGDPVIPADTDPVIRVVDETRLQVAVPVSRADLARITPGLPITVAAPGNPPEPVTIAVMPPGDPNVLTVELRLGFVGKTALTRDAVVDAEFIVDQRADVLVIPRKAVQRDEEASVSYVLVAGTDNLAHKKIVTVGFGTRDQIQILTGISAGERVILNGFDLLADGSPISIGK